jgi:S-adenosylmethionine synthetase
VFSLPERGKHVLFFGIRQLLIFLENPMLTRYVSSESVTEGHPDKLADRISDSILDAFLAQDPKSRVACETLVTKGLVLVAGEITSHAEFVNVQDTVRQAIREVGYTSTNLGFDADNAAVLNTITGQSPEIASGVNVSWEWRGGDKDPRNERGAGDQGLMFGYATTETPELMPTPIWLAHRISRRLAEVRKNGTLSYLRPDGKSQVTLLYDGAKPVGLETVVISTQHAESISQEQIRADLIEQVITPVVPDWLDAGQVLYLINPSGSFVFGGPGADTGLTGRKIIVDTYGGAIPHGGGAFSGKDPTKVDRSAAYYARYIAKNIVAAGLAERAMVEVAYAIGKAHPVSLRVESFGTGKVSDQQLSALAREHFDPRPLAIIEELQLERPIYVPTSSYGHFGQAGLPWEQTDRAEKLA